MFSGEIVYLSISTESLTQGKYYLSSHQRTLNDCFQSAADHQGPTAVGQREADLPVRSGDEYHRP